MATFKDIVRLIYTYSCADSITQPCQNIIKNFPDINQQDDEGKTLLMYTAATVGIGMLQAILERDDVDVDIQDNDGWTALMHSIYAGMRCSARRIVEKNPDVYLVNNNGKNAIDFAFERRNMDLHKRLEKMEPKVKYNFVAEPIVLVV